MSSDPIDYCSILKFLQTLHMLVLSRLQSFSIWFRSGNWDGCGRTLILCSVTHFFFILMFVLNQCLDKIFNHDSSGILVDLYSQLSSLMLTKGANIFADVNLEYL